VTYQPGATLLPGLIDTHTAICVATVIPARWTGCPKAACAAASAGCGTSLPTGCGSLRWPGSSPAGAGPRSPHHASDAADLVPRTGRGEVRHGQIAQGRSRRIRPSSGAGSPSSGVRSSTPPSSTSSQPPTSASSTRCTLRAAGVMRCGHLPPSSARPSPTSPSGALLTCARLRAAAGMFQPRRPLAGRISQH
jgi:hypothetical protein